MVIIVVWIRSLLESFSSWKVSHLKREYNTVAHELAKFAKCKGISPVWKGIAPPFVQHLLQSLLYLVFWYCIQTLLYINFSWMNQDFLSNIYIVVWCCYKVALPCGWCSDLLWQWWCFSHEFWSQWEGGCEILTSEFFFLRSDSHPMKRIMAS